MLVLRFIECCLTYLFNQGFYLFFIMVPQPAQQVKQIFMFAVIKIIRLPNITQKIMSKLFSNKRHTRLVLRPNHKWWRNTVVYSFRGYLSVFHKAASQISKRLHCSYLDACSSTFFIDYCNYLWQNYFKPFIIRIVFLPCMCLCTDIQSLQPHL